MTVAPWTTPEMTGVGHLPMHAVTHADGRLVLDGTWHFQLLDRPDAEPGAGWRNIEVPGCWTLQGTTDLPHYTNVQMPFEGQPPSVPLANPTGLYERTFDRPGDWAGRRVVLHVGAAESILHRDPQRARGRDQQGLPPRRGVRRKRPPRRGSQHARPARGQVVRRDLDVEDQDQWWHGGITRSVFLYATGATRLADVRADASLADDLRTGTLELAVEIGFDGPRLAAGWLVEARLGDAAAVRVPVAPTLPPDPRRRSPSAT